MSNITRRNYDSLFQDLFDFPFLVDSHHNELMRTDIEELDDSYNVRIEVPSVKKEDIKVSLEDGSLVVSVEKKNTDVEKDNKGKIIHKERYFGSFKRSYFLGDDVKEKDLSAKLEDGVLTINIKKPVPEEKTSNTKFIEIN